MQVESSAAPLLTIDEVEKVQRPRLASFIGHVFQLTSYAVLVDKLIQQEKLNHCHGLKTIYLRPCFTIKLWCQLPLHKSRHKF